MAPGPPCRPRSRAAGHDGESNSAASTAGSRCRWPGRRDLRVAVAVAVAAPNGPISPPACAAGSRAPVRPHAAGVVQVSAAPSPAIARSPTACPSARSSAEWHRVASQYGTPGVRRHRADERALRQDDVDRPHGARRVPAPRVQEVLEGDADDRLRVQDVAFIDERACLECPEVDLRAARRLRHGHLDAVRLVVGLGVGVDDRLALPEPSGTAASPAAIRSAHASQT